MNHFIKVTDVEGSVVYIRPEHISAVADFQDVDYSRVILSNGRYIEIPKGQISMDCLINRNQSAGVRVL